MTTLSISTEDAPGIPCRAPSPVFSCAAERAEEDVLCMVRPEVMPVRIQTAAPGLAKDPEKRERGFQLETCSGPAGCPHRAVIDQELLDLLERSLEAEDLAGFLTARISGKLRAHHRFHVAVSWCPNGCSRPQIADVGIIGACRPELSSDACARCQACVDTCREEALAVGGTRPVIVWSRRRCVACGQCARVCPTSAIQPGRTGYRVQLGGKLGRHPRLARELPGIYRKEEVLVVVRRVVAHFKTHYRYGERLGDILERATFAGLGRESGPEA